MEVMMFDLAPFLNHYEMRELMNPGKVTSVVQDFNVVLTLYIVFEVIVDFSTLTISIKNDSMHNLNVGVFK